MLWFVIRLILHSFGSASVNNATFVLPKTSTQNVENFMLNASSFQFAGELQGSRISNIWEERSCHWSVTIHRDKSFRIMHREFVFSVWNMCIDPAARVFFLLWRKRGQPIDPFGDIHTTWTMSSFYSCDIPRGVKILEFVAMQKQIQNPSENRINPSE